MKRRASARVLPTVVALAIAVSGLYTAPVAPPARAADAPPLPITHQHFNGVEGVLTQNSDGTGGVSGFKNVPGLLCTGAASSTADVNTDCEGTAPHNETTIAVNPTNPSNMIGGANDYQLRLSSGGTVYETIFSRAHVTFDGG